MNVPSPTPSSPSSRADVARAAEDDATAAETRAIETTRAAGRGGVAVLGAKVFFIGVGFIQQPILQAIVGLADFGGYSRVMAAAGIVNNVVIQSSTQAVSRAVSRARVHGLEGEALRTTLRVHVPLAIVLTLFCVAAAPHVAMFEGDMRLTVPLVVLSGVVLLYGLYAPLIGALNGRGLFTRQAALDVTFATLRTAGLLGVGYFFMRNGWSGMLGASLGFVAAAACIVPLAARLTGVGKPVSVIHEALPRERAYLKQLLTIAATQLFINLLMQVDILVLGRFLSLGAADAGLDKDAANRWTAVYRDCQLFAFLPYQLLFSVTQVLFPMVARAKAEGDTTAVREYVARGARLGAIACGLIVGVVVALPWHLLNFAFGNAPQGGVQVADGGEQTLRILALAQACFAMLGIASTVLNSIGKERLGSAITFGAVAIVAGACWLVVPGAEFGPQKLVLTAMATGGALLAALVAAGLTVRKQTGSFVPAGTIGRVGLAVGLCVAAGLYLPHFTNRLLAPVLALGVAVAYVGVLVATRELTGADVAAIKAMLSRRKKKAT